MNDVETKRPAKVFLSCVSSDKPSARFIADPLSQSGVSTWFDEWEIRVGDSLLQPIEAAVSILPTMLLITCRSAFMCTTVCRTASCFTPSGWRSGGILPTA
jgi:hypothetical protein